MMKKHHRYFRIEDKSYRASFTLGKLLKEMDFKINLIKLDDKYVDLLHYVNADSQKMEFRKDKVRILFDYTHIWVWYSGKLLWDGYEINHFFLLQLNYLSMLHDKYADKYIHELEHIEGFNQGYQDSLYFT